MLRKSRDLKVRSKSTVSFFSFALIATIATISSGSVHAASDMRSIQTFDHGLVQCDESAPETDPCHLTIASVEVEEVELSEDDSIDHFLPKYPKPLTTPVPGWDILKDLRNGTLVLDQILNYGARIWKIVEANKPVVNVKVATANALPAGTRDWRGYQGWQTPRSRVYRISYKNFYGINVVDFSYRVLYTYGGNVFGKGRYLTNVTILPANLSVAWGYKFDAESAVPSVLNAGTVANPVAAMELLMKWSVDTVVSHNQMTTSFFVRGDGEFVNLTNGT